MRIIAKSVALAAVGVLALGAGGIVTTKDATAA